MNKPKTPETQNIGTIIGQRLCNSLVGKGLPYRVLEEAIYGELEAISKDLIVGDWLEFPDGSQFTLEFKPKGY